jgi:hypothetical protein
MSNSSVNQARHAAPTRQPVVSDAPLTEAWAADVQMGKLQGEHDAVEDVRDRVAGYLDEAKRTFPSAADQLRTFLATQSSGLNGHSGRPATADRAPHDPKRPGTA